PIATQAPIAFDHVHLTGPDPAAMRDWYAKTFGAKIGSQSFLAKTLDLPPVMGVVQLSRVDRVAFSLMNSQPPYSAPPAVVGSGTKTHAVDHIGFEIKGLEARWPALEKAAGKVESAPRKAGANGSITYAFIFDPWGTLIELTEGYSAQ